jgi:hypothetical protein
MSAVIEPHGEVVVTVPVPREVSTDDWSTTVDDDRLAGSTLKQQVIRLADSYATFDPTGEA